MRPVLPELTLQPIGLVHSPLREKHSAPRQPALAHDVCGRIELLPGGAFEHALCDLASWSHIWVLFWFHMNDSWHAKVLPPRSRKKRGVFATRSPHRPNPLGMSVLRLTAVEGRVLHVRDLDILDQTPVLDIKPYVAYTDSVPDASAGWLPDAQAEPVDPGPHYQVAFDRLASEQLAWLDGQVAFDLKTAIENVLQVGPTPHPYRRITLDGDGSSVLAVKDFRARFSVRGELVQVHEIATGYRERVLRDPAASASDDTPLSVHRAFVARFMKGPAVWTQH
jgi:tRNA-Thr(GGU) m(6)t(6)A37 methyltransferase TsaA